MTTNSLKLKNDRIEASREAAIAFVEDFDYLEALVTQDKTVRADLRRASSVIRRLLIENDLPSIASPRIGARFKIIAPDNQPIYVSARKEPFLFFMSGGADLFGIVIAAGMIETSNHPRKIIDYDPEKRIELELQSFLKQNVICYKGQWVTRHDVIKYVANVASGVHTGRHKSVADDLLKKARPVFNISLTDEVTRINANTNALHDEELPIQYIPESIDCVLIELLVTASLFVNSPDIISLYSYIKNESLNF